MVLALMRLKDAPRHALRLDHIARTLSNPHVIDALAADSPLPQNQGSDETGSRSARRGASGADPANIRRAALTMPYVTSATNAGTSGSHIGI